MNLSTAPKELQDPKIESFRQVGKIAGALYGSRRDMPLDEINRIDASFREGGGSLIRFAKERGTTLADAASLLVTSGNMDQDDFRNRAARLATSDFHVARDRPVPDLAAGIGRVQDSVRTSDIRNTPAPGRLAAMRKMTPLDAAVGLERLAFDYDRKGEPACEVTRTAIGLSFAVAEQELEKVRGREETVTGVSRKAKRTEDVRD